MSRVFIGVGSNQGNRLQHISRAVQQLQATEGVCVVQMATILETEPVGGPPQESYLNTVVELASTLEPRPLLRLFQAIERQLGRAPSSQRWGPRPIDLDLLLYEDRVVQDADLVVPHPRLHERRFALEPLAQLAPDVIHPILQRSVAELLAALPPVRGAAASGQPGVSVPCA